jgi:hypothetical protein
MKYILEQKVKGVWTRVKGTITRDTFHEALAALNQQIDTKKPGIRDACRLKPEGCSMKRWIMEQYIREEWRHCGTVFTRETAHEALDAMAKLIAAADVIDNIDMRDERRLKYSGPVS